MAHAPQGQRDRGPGQRGQGQRGERGDQDLFDKLVSINRVAKVVKGGKRFSFSALVVLGDGNGKVGYGLGKAKEVPAAIRKATDRAKRDMKLVSILDGTIPHEVFGKYYRETPGIWIAYTKDVVHWYGHREILLPDVLDTKLGPGSTPIKTPHGWLPLNHAVKIEETCESGTRRYITLKEQEAKGEKGDDDTRVYTPQAILLDLHQPHKCIGVSEDLAEPNGWEVNPKLHIKHLMITQAMKGLLVDGQVTKTIIGFYGGGDTSFGALVMDEDYVTNSIYKVPQERIPQPTPKP